jgi:hypothetical protein
MSMRPVITFADRIFLHYVERRRPIPRDGSSLRPADYESGPPLTAATPLTSGNG